MIEPTDEMVAAFSAADFSGLGNADWEDSHVRVGLAAVLAVVERDYVVRPAVHRVNERLRARQPGLTAEAADRARSEAERLPTVGQWPCEAPS